jgi:hypothetical protein
VAIVLKTNPLGRGREYPIHEYKNYLGRRINWVMGPGGVRNEKDCAGDSGHYPSSCLLFKNSTL